MRHDADRISDILDAIEKIQSRLTTREIFDSDEMLRVWCLHHIVVIGEAASRISESFRKQNENIPWRRIVAMRNAVVHGYFKVDWAQVWVVVETELTPLQQQLSPIYSQM